MKLVCDKMEIVECDTILEKIRAEINYFQAKNKKRNSDVREEVSVDPIVLRAADYEQVVNSPSAKKKVCKSLIDLCPFRKRQRTEDIYNMMKEFVDEENKLQGNDESPFTIRQLLGHLLHRSEYRDGDKKLSEVGMMLMNGQNILDRFHFDETDAVSLVHDMTLSKDMRVLKRYLEKLHLGFPNTNKLLEA